MSNLGSWIYKQQKGNHSGLPGRRQLRKAIIIIIIDCCTTTTTTTSVGFSDKMDEGGHSSVCKVFGYIGVLNEFQSRRLQLQANKGTENYYYPAHKAYLTEKRVRSTFGT